MWLAEAIASQPPVAVAGTLRAIWAANDMGRENALAMAASILTTGTDTAALAAGGRRLRLGEAHRAPRALSLWFGSPRVARGLRVARPQLAARRAFASFLTRASSTRSGRAL